MKTLDEQFNEEFGVFLHSVLHGYSSELRKNINKFYNQKIEAIVAEMIGESVDTEDPEDLGYNYKRNEIIDIAKRYGIIIK